MKKLSIVFSVFAFTLAIAAAYVTEANSSSFTTYYAQILDDPDTQPNEQDCVSRPIVGADNCTSGTVQCKVQLTPTVQVDAFRVDNGTSCATLAKRP
jgi:hypothetical protein